MIVTGKAIANQKEKNVYLIVMNKEEGKKKSNEIYN